MSIHGHSPNDNGFASRKYWSALLAMTLIFVATLLCHRIPEIVSIYPVYTGAIIAVLGAYFATNVTQKHLAGKAQATLIPLTPAAPAPVSP